MTAKKPPASICKMVSPNCSARSERRFDRLEERMDRMVRVLMGGLFMVVAALIGVVAPIVWWVIR